jgi:hypothetical protein
VTTAFQERYLLAHMCRDTQTLPLIGGRRPAKPFDRLVFAITSSNQSHSRYNPVPLEVRAVAIDRFARRLRDAMGVSYRIVPVPHFPPSPRFAEILLKEITEATEDDLKLMPEDTAIFSSTPEVIEQFVKLGFSILTGELETATVGRPRSELKYIARTPNEIVKLFVSVGENWGTNAEVRGELSPATFSVWHDFPDVPTRILRLYRDPLLTDSGSLTETRSYSTYAAGMNNPAIIEIKYSDIKSAIVPGKIVDEGCADGALLAPIARDFPDSDLIGIEITGEFLARCKERQRALEYGGTYIHFHQRNITQPIFAANSIDTTICNSTTHELWSYGKQAETVRAYLRAKFLQTRRNGRILIRDVVGPADRLREVYLWCDASDGKSAGKLEELSTAARFEKFAAEYLAQTDRPERIKFRAETIDGKKYFALPLHQAMEFLLKKDYTDNWASELHEEFCFWSFEEWKHELTDAGFSVIENPNEPTRGSRAYASEWIVKNRFEGKVGLFVRDGDGLRKIDWPVTNMVLIGEKS